MPGTPSRHVDRRLAFVVGMVIAAVVAGCSAGTPSAAPVTLRLQVSLTPEELATFQPAITALDAAHPEWVIALENVPQASEVEKVTSQLAADDMPDLLRLQGSNVQQWIRRDAFVDLSANITAAGLDLADFYDGPLDQFRWHDGLWGLPDTASPEIVFFDRAAFAAAGLAPPTDAWTLDDMRTAAIALTVDGAGRHPGDAGFDPATITRWGWNGGVTYLLAGRAHPGTRRRTVRDRRLHDDVVHRRREPGRLRLVGQPRQGRPRRALRPIRRIADRGPRRPVHLRQGGDGLERVVRHRPAQCRRHHRLRHRPAVPRHGRSAAHAAEHQRLRHRRPQQAPGRGVGAPPGPHRPGFPGLDVGQARPCRAGSPVRGVVGRRHLAPRRRTRRRSSRRWRSARSSVRTPPGRATRTPARSTCSPR